jgi:hypothetical protein
MLLSLHGEAKARERTSVQGKAPEHQRQAPPIIGG